jgi:hypothetical protein
MPRRRDYEHERSRADQLASERGFANRAEQRRYARRPRSSKELIALPDRAQDVRKDVTRVLDLGRGRRDVESAAAELDVPMSAVRWWGDEALGRKHAGRTQVSRRDIARLRFVILDDGVQPVAVRGWKRLETERIFDVQWRALSGQASAEELRWLQGRTVAGRRVVDDEERLRELGRRGVVDPGEWYRESQS